MKRKIEKNKPYGRLLATEIIRFGDKARRWSFHATKGWRSSAA